MDLDEDQITLFVDLLRLKHDEVNFGKAGRNTCKSYPCI